tara:strand:+ start:1352 stop:1741 length:390 start_codon:yes stop_codon:yes gene_type:complete
MHFIGNKEQGLYAELQFMVDAYAHGIVCARPQMEQKFDLYAEGIKGVKKVQVKCTQRLTKVNNYKFTISYGSGYKEQYKENQIDIFALYAIPIKTWWLIPLESVGTLKTITLNTDVEKYKKYINNFDLI